jgi:hypothetical protein
VTVSVQTATEIANIVVDFGAQQVQEPRLERGFSGLQPLGLPLSYSHSEFGDALAWDNELFIG